MNLEYLLPMLLGCGAFFGSTTNVMEKQKEEKEEEQEAQEEDTRFGPKFFLVLSAIMAVAFVVAAITDQHGFLEGKIAYIAPIAGSIALFFAAYFSYVVLKKPIGTKIMASLSKAIQEGAMAFLKREYRSIAIFVVVVAIVIGVTISLFAAIAYVFGAILSGTAGLVGLRIATKANARTTNAAKTGLSAALDVAFKGGSVMGLTVAGLGLLGLSVAFLIFQVFLPTSDTPRIIVGFALGASTVALFARVGGGIFTKAADIGADLVGKVEAGIPEDDPRNPAVIADNVGDNVGDVAGMGADLFESYVGAIVAPLALGALLFPDNLIGMVLPMLIASVGIIASIIGIYFVRTSEGGHPGSALSIGTFSAAILSALGSFGLVWFLMGPEKLAFFWAILAGLVAGMIIGQISEYYTSDKYKPVKEIAGQAKTGSATVILSGIAEGMLSTASSIIVLVTAIAVAFIAGEAAMSGGGVYAISLAAIGMLSTTGIVVAVDAYGPIADNAGGIAEMAHLDPKVREITDNLDAVGNTTAAIAKGFAIGSAAITALALFQAFIKVVGIDGIDITKYQAIIGLFVGGMFPYFFSSMTIKAVGRAAHKMIEEVRRQFKEIPGLREGKEGVKPDYTRGVDISTAAALKEMMLPGILAIVSPVLIGLWSTEALGAFLAGALVSGFLLAIMMANSGGAWDNAKKYVEAGNLGGKGTDVHAATVVGDTVGDPFKDTAGPSMNILIKVMTVVALLFAPLFSAL